jgi:hypothetical protein
MNHVLSLFFFSSSIVIFPYIELKKNMLRIMKSKEKIILGEHQELIIV